MPITTFTTLAGTDIDALSPAKESVFDALYDRALHCREALYDASIHTPKVAHDHDGICSAKVFPPNLPNLMLYGHPSAGWTLSGSAAHSANGLSITAASASAYRILIDGTAATSKSVFGTGCDLVVSCAIRATGTFTNLGLEFGLGDSTTFRAGAKGTATHATISTSWQRFYFTLSGFSASTGTNVAFLVKTTASFSGGTKVEVDYCSVRAGTRLSFWQPGYCEAAHAHWRNLQQSACPVFDRAIMFTNAVSLTPS